ncbi:large proline-rich protein bag6-A [Xenopus laevis]|uniref:Large proline-rich protein bag6-A n=1 Tax=Xenopus laevis TaxID=8355 RepID=BAG6A_XENLA|nr:large proline-rich protein bag6-A [Xenopus laevis]Q9YHD3.1 RecName: Full=Large proline-rich protein bag6-A; AltName: Full=BCL2-associated athanogene 6; AltName: Full=HLA-B-associated transcript 3-A; AltName: Full=Protein Scythe [Xenopus laevis]AAC83822.1 Scythe [Xenopus laevis]
MAANEKMEVTVKTLDSQTRTFTVETEISVKDFKAHISSDVGISPEKQRLIYQGRVLQEDKKLKEYNVDGKVIHLVERAPPQTQPSTGGPSTSSSTSPTSSNAAPVPGAPERNGNSYVMVGTFNLPHVMSGLVRQQRPSVSTVNGNDGSTLDVHINLDQQLPVQSEPRVRLVLAQHILQDIQRILDRLEGQAVNEQAAEPMDTAESEGEASSRETLPQTTQNTDGQSNTTPTSHPSPSEYVEVLQSLSRVEERLAPFMQRYREILSSATSDAYENQEEREQSQRIINLVGESLRLLGNALVAVSDLRCNLSSASPRHLHVVRPMSHYSGPMLLQQAAIPIQINVGTTVTATGNGTHAGHMPSDGNAAQPPSTNTSEPQRPNTENQPPSNGERPASDAPPTSVPHPHPRVIRITHQTVEPVMMMHMNIQDSASGGPTTIPPPTAGHGGSAHIHMPGLPPEFMQAISHQITQQAMAAASGQQIPGFQAPPRFVFTRPAAPSFQFQPGTATTPPGPGGATTTVPGATVGPAGNASLAQMISGLVGQLLMHPVVVAQGGSSTSSSTSSSTFTSTSSSASSSSSTDTTSTTTTSSTANPTVSSVPSSQPPPGTDQHLSQLLGSLLGTASSGMSNITMGSPSITVTVPGMPAFLQGVTDILQATQTVPVSTAPTQSASQAPPPSSPPPPPAHSSPPPAAAPESLPPEFFTSVVQGVLSSMLGSLSAADQSGTESIAAFIQRLSGTHNIFQPDAEGPGGFFGDLLTLICHNFSLVDMVMLLHGHSQPLQNLQPQLRSFFLQEYLHQVDPTPNNIQMASRNLTNGLEEYIRESFASVTVRDDVDITRTNIEFLQDQFNRITTHILHCADSTFGQRLLEMCNQSLFEWLALNLYCLRGDQNALTSVINERIRRLSLDVSPVLVSWVTSVLSLRLQVLLGQMPVTEGEIQRHVRRVGDAPQVPEPSSQEQPMETMPVDCQNGAASPVLATHSGGVLFLPPQSSVPTICPDSDHPTQEDGGSEQWAASVPPEWVPVIRQDMQNQRKIKQQPPLSDAYLSGMPAKRRKTMQGEGPHLSLSEAVSRAMKATGAKPESSAECVRRELDNSEAQGRYREQLCQDIQKTLQDNESYSAQRFPNTQRAFRGDP